MVLVSGSGLRVARVGDGVTPGPMPWTPSQCQERTGRGGAEPSRVGVGVGLGRVSGSCRDRPWGRRLRAPLDQSWGTQGLVPL